MTQALAAVLSFTGTLATSLITKVQASSASFSGSLFTNKKSGTTNYPTFAPPPSPVSFSGSLALVHHSPIPKALTGKASFSGSLFTNKKSGTVNTPTFTPPAPSVSFSGSLALVHNFPQGRGQHNLDFAGTLLVVKTTGTTHSPVFPPPAPALSLSGSLVTRQNPRHVNLTAGLTPKGSMLQRQH